MRVSGSRQQTLGDWRGSISLGGVTDFGRGNPPVVAPAVGRQEGRHGGENPFTLADSSILVGAIPPWLPRL